MIVIPGVRAPNTAPVGLCPTYLAEWPDEETNPFNSTYDYQINNLNGQTCVGITFLGKDQSNKQPGWSGSSRGGPEVFQDSDDLFINLGCGVRSLPVKSSSQGTPMFLSGFTGLQQVASRWVMTLIKAQILSKGRCSVRGGIEGNGQFSRKLLVPFIQGVSDQNLRQGQDFKGRISGGDPDSSPGQGRGGHFGAIASKTFQNRFLAQGVGALKKKSSAVQFPGQ